MPLGDSSSPRQRVAGGANSPLNTVCTVAKYEPMGTTIIAKVKARSLRMTSLVIHDVSEEVGVPSGRLSSQTYVGTAGLMLDG